MTSAQKWVQDLKLCHMLEITPPFLFDKNTLKHLRLPFSFHLMPVFLFALSQAAAIHWLHTIAAFLILHLLIYPASNGYNSYQDKDETSIGGLKHPPRVTKNLFYVTLFLDVIGTVLSFFISVPFAMCVLIYILISRAYSYRKLRLKKYPVMGFLTVFIFQGAFTYLMAAISINKEIDLQTIFSKANILCMTISSFFIGSVYPLTQIYQHEADKKDGVVTLSYKLGYTGTFLFSALLFAMATAILSYYFDEKHQQFSVLVFFIMMLPVIVRLFYWYHKVYRNSSAANFENTMSMNLLASSCMNIYFLILTGNNFLAWF